MEILEAVLDLQSEMIMDLERGIVRALKYGDVETAKKKRRIMIDLETEKQVLIRVWYRRAGKR